MSTVVHVLVSLAPVLVLLGLLVVLDSYRLIPSRQLLVAILAGCLAAIVSFGIHAWFLAPAGLDPTLLRRYAAPAVEETLKAAYLFHLIRTRRVGFLVDAAIFGFAVGAGFALLENVYYLRQLTGAGIWIWIVRGFGTAVMHGSTSAIFAILAKSLTDRRESTSLPRFAPALLVAFGIHALFNHFLLSPLATTALLMATLPPVVMVVFERSERVTREWLGTGFDTDVELLELIHGGQIGETRIGHYLESLKSRFPGPVVADMLCLLEIHLELSARGKGFLLARAAGIRVPVDEDVRSRLEELKFLERSVGATGKLAMEPILRVRSRDLWELYMLERGSG